MVIGSGGGTPPAPSTAPDYEELRRRLAGAVASVCPGWLASSRDDVVQAALVRLVARGRFGARSQELSPAYLWRTAYCALVDEIRRVQRRAEVAWQEEPGAARVEDVGPNPEVRSRAAEIGRAIRDCLDAAAPPRRLAVILRLQGHTVREVAQLLGWSAKRAENLAYRGLADLRRCLERKGLRP